MKKTMVTLLIATMSFAAAAIPVFAAAPKKSTISENQAKLIVLTDAGLSEKEVSGIKVNYETDNGRKGYEVKEAKKTDKRSDKKSKKEQVTAQKALEIAMKDAGVSEKDLLYHEAHAESEDGKTEYDVEFRTGNEEYSYTIGKDSGKILEHEIDRDV